MATVMTRKIDGGIVYDEDSTAAIEVIVSIGEFDGTMLGITTDSYEMIQLSHAAAQNLMFALQDALNMHVDAESE
jgi:hypothetical protein